MPLALKIDGKRLDGIPATFHYQKDPYPGGHAYTLIIDETELVASLKNITSLNPNKPSEIECEQCFQLLLLYIDTIQEYQKCSFVLNNITDLNFEQELLIMKGVCSEIQ